MTSLHDKQFPGESAAYRSARNRLLEAELALEHDIKAVNDLRSALPEGGNVAEDYQFDTIHDGKVGQVVLSDLFRGDKGSLLLYSFMYGPDDEAPCPACTSVIDGLNGVGHHMSDRINFAICVRAPIERLAALAAARDWTRVQLLSAANNTYNRDYFAETPDGRQLPAANVFVRRNGTINHFYSAEQLYVDQPGHPRHVDRIWPIWNVLDLTPEGRGDNWFPKLGY